MSHAHDALREVITSELCFVTSRSSERMKPGRAILRRTAKARALLAQLTSDDVRDVRADDPTLFCDATYLKGGSVEKLLTDFDRTLRR